MYISGKRCGEEKHVCVVVVACLCGWRAVCRGVVFGSEATCLGLVAAVVGSGVGVCVDGGAGRWYGAGQDEMEWV